jgi:hypothetical protein
MVESDFRDPEGAETVGFSHADFGLVIQPSMTPLETAVRARK